MPPKLLPKVAVNKHSVGSYPFASISNKKNSEDNGKIVADRNVIRNNPENPSEI